MIMAFSDSYEKNVTESGILCDSEGTGGLRKSRDIRSITVTIIRIRIWYCIRNIHMRMLAVC